MAVTADDVTTELGRDPFPDGSVLEQQAAARIERAYRAIRARADRLGVTYDTIDPLAVDDVVLAAVVRMAGRPNDGAEQVTDQVAIDDGSMSSTRRFTAGQGDVFILDSWWDTLGLAEPTVTEWSGSLPYVRSR